MRRSSLYLIAGVLAIAAVTLNSCKKVNGINNNQVIETPYSLYAADSAGTLYNSNDGKTFTVMFTPDGYPSRAICIADTNLLWVKKNLYISQNNGVSYNRMFNHSYDSVSDFVHPGPPPVVPPQDVYGTYLHSNQTMIYNMQGWGRTYIISSDPAYYNSLGIAFSDKDGILGSWQTELYFDTINILPGYHITSFTQLKNGTAFALDYHTEKTIYRQNKGTWWTAKPIVTPLPSGTLPGVYSLGHYNNELIAIDNSGRNGAFYSDDSGANWLPFTGLPSNVPLQCCYSPFEQVCMVGTKGAGLYILNPNLHTFQANNNGLGVNAVVNNITAKENIYKNNTTQQYIYLATNSGIYQSVDGGQNWVLDYKGNFINIY